MSLDVPTHLEALLADTRVGKRAYLLGAGGCGMSGLGHLLLDQGWSIAGSDLIVNDETRELARRGATLFQGHTAEQLEQVQPTLVIYSTAIPATNPEWVQAERLKIPLFHRAVVLAAMMNRQQGICVAGMHGKTTTTALLTYALIRLQASPSYAIGGLVPQVKPHARWSPPPHAGPSPWFVVEADESDGSLREFNPVHAILLNIDEEHLDHYSDLNHIARVFGEFASQTRGTVITCADDDGLCCLMETQPDACSYGMAAHADYCAARIESPGVWRFTVRHRDEVLGPFETGLLGEQNLANATAVVAMLHQLGYKPEAIAAAIAGFRGVVRRQELLFASDRCRIYDDYGHHPREIAATIRALRTLRPKRLLVAFQPHRFTRTQHLLSQFGGCFRGADRLWITEIYAASEPAIAGINGALLADAVRQQGQDAQFIGSLTELQAAVEAAMRPGDIVLFLGAGDITLAARRMAANLANGARPAGVNGMAQVAGSPASASLDRLRPVIDAISEEGSWRRDESLAKHTSLRIGGPADLYVEPASEAELARLLVCCRHQKIPMFFLGRGSNLLVRDRGIRGVVCCLNHRNFSRIRIEGRMIHCGAGARLKSLVLEAKRHGLGGLEFLEGIPGSVGGALRMNAGAMGASVFDVVESVRVMDSAGRIQVKAASDLRVEYRCCPSLSGAVVLEAVFRGEPAPQEQISQTLAAFSERRWNTQPAAASAGCVFRNPRSIPAGRLIDELGLKGQRIGGALVSDLHANFIVNTGSATADDVLRLIEMIRDRARKERGIELETELMIVGE